MKTKLNIDTLQKMEAGPEDTAKFWNLTISRRLKQKKGQPIKK